MKQVVVFALYAIDSMACYQDVQEQANAWLTAHPDATILASHTNMSAGDARGDSQYSEFALTLIVEVPDGQPE